MTSKSERKAVALDWLDRIIAVVKPMAERDEPHSIPARGHARDLLREIEEARRSILRDNLEVSDRP